MFIEILLLLMVVVFSTPILGSSSNIIMVCLAAAVYLIVNYKYVFTHKNAVLVNSILLYVIVMFGYKFAGISSAEWGNYMNQLAFFISLLLMLLLVKMKDIQFKPYFLWIVFFIIAFNIADNIRLSILYPQINTGRIFMDEEFLASINAGGTRFYSFSLFFLNVCYLTFLNCKKKSIRNLMFILTVLSAVYIFAFCLKAAVVVYGLISLVFIFYAKRVKNKKLFFFVLGVTGLLSFIIISLFEEAIIDFIISISPDKRLTTRLVTLINPEDEEAQMGTVTGRTKLYMMSIETWLANIGNFLFGIGDHRAQFGAAATGIGQHGAFLDSLARYGLIGFVLLFLVFKHAFKTILSFFDKEYRLQIICILVVFVLCGFTKGIFFPSMGLVMFLVLPLSARLINKC